MSGTRHDRERLFPWVAMIISVALPLGLALWTGLGFRPQYDEGAHKAFSEYLAHHPYWDTVITYRGSENYEAKGPLFFTLGALFGGATNFDLQSLRVLALFFCFAALCGFQRLLALAREKASIGMGLSVACLPYFLMLGMTFMTEIPSLAFLFAGLWGYLTHVDRGGNGRLLLGIVSVTAASYIRVDYLFILGGIAYMCWRHKRLSSTMVISLLLPIVLRIPLIVVWGGLAAPPAQARPNAVGMGFRASHFVFVLAVLGLYFWPFLLRRLDFLRSRISSTALFGAFMGLFALCLAFPPELIPGNVDCYGGTLRSLMLGFKLTPLFQTAGWVFFASLGLAVCILALTETDLKNIANTALRAGCLIGIFMQLLRGNVMYERYLIGITPLLLLLLLRSSPSSPVLFLWSAWGLGLQLLQMARNGVLP